MCPFLLKIIIQGLWREIYLYIDLLSLEKYFEMDECKQNPSEFSWNVLQTCLIWPVDRSADASGRAGQELWWSRVYLLVQRSTSTQIWFAASSEPQINLLQTFDQYWTQICKPTLMNWAQMLVICPTWMTGDGGYFKSKPINIITLALDSWTYLCVWRSSVFINVMTDQSFIIHYEIYESVLNKYVSKQINDYKVTAPACR